MHLYYQLEYNIKLQQAARKCYLLTDRWNFSTNWEKQKVKNTASKLACSPWQGGSNLQGNSNIIITGMKITPKTKLNLAPLTHQLTGSHVESTYQVWLYLDFNYLELQYHSNSHKNNPTWSLTPYCIFDPSLDAIGLPTFQKDLNNKNLTWSWIW